MHCFLRRDGLCWRHWVLGGISQKQDLLEVPGMRITVGGGGGDFCKPTYGLHSRHQPLDMRTTNNMVLALETHPPTVFESLPPRDRSAKKPSCKPIRSQKKKLHPKPYPYTLNPKSQALPVTPQAPSPKREPQAGFRVQVLGFRG